METPRSRTASGSNQSVHQPAPTDLEFLCNVTALPTDKLLTLIADDFDLVLDSISDRDLNHTVSFSMFTKLTIFRETKGTDFPLNEKAYVADCVALHYPEAYKQSHYLVDRKELTEQDGQFYLVLTGMFPEFIYKKQVRNGAPSLNYYTGLAKRAFSQSNRENLANHIDDWVELLYYIKTYCWN